MRHVVSKIVSGGQTGADRAALDWAIEHDIPHGGYCPKGRLAEDGVISERYNLTETRSKDYLKRTEANMKESDGTVIFTCLPKLKGRQSSPPICHRTWEAVATRLVRCAD